MELTDWTSGLDQQTAQNNLAASPEGQMARQQGLANLALTQGQVQRQQYDLQSKQLELSANKRAAEALAKYSQGQQAEGEKSARAPSVIEGLESGIQADTIRANAYREAGDFARADEIDKTISQKTEQVHKIKNYDVDNLAKMNGVAKTWNQDIQRAAGAARSSPGGLANYINLVKNIKEQAEKYNMHDPVLDQLLAIDPRSPDGLKFIQRMGETANFLAKQGDNAVAGTRVAQYDDFVTTQKTKQVEKTRAEVRAEAAVQSARKSEGGDTEKSTINPTKNGWPDWDKLSPEDKEIQLNNISKARKIVDASTNRTGAIPRNKDAVAVAEVRAAYENQMATIKGTRDSLKTPEMLAQDRSGLNVPQEKLQADADRFASIARNKDKKSTIGGKDLLRIATDEMNGKPRPTGLGESNNTALESMISSLENAGMERKDIEKPMTGAQHAATNRMISALGSLNGIASAISKLPSDSRVGVLPYIGNGEGMLKYLESYGSQTASKASTKFLDRIMKGVGRDLANLETGGVATGLIGISKQLEEAVSFKEGETNTDVVGNLAEIRRIAEGHIEPLIKSGQLKGASKTEAENELKNLKKLIPFTVDDVAVIEAGGRPTIGDATGKIIDGKSASPESSKAADDYLKSIGVH